MYMRCVREGENDKMITIVLNVAFYTASWRLSDFLNVG